MNLRGGIIIIGSLYWDDSQLRRSWRRNTFLDASKPVHTSVKIRYGRKSQSRENNYTMVLSNHPTTKAGKAMILELKSSVKSFRGLEKVAYNLAKAEGIYKAPKQPKLNSTWGTVGILLNPKLNKTDSNASEMVHERWSELYHQYENFNPAHYTISKKEDPVIDKNGILNISWTKPMQEFDFLLATVTQPNPPKALSPNQIANKIVQTGNGEYFFKNRKHKITTFQDKEILEVLREKGFKY